MCENCFKPLACSFHCHSHHSLDGGSTPAQLIEESIRLGRPGIALTDHGSMAGIMGAYKLAKDKKLKFAPGIEAYVNFPEFTRSREHKDKHITHTMGYTHLTIHFLTLNAYEHFCKLSLAAADRGPFVYKELKPIILANDLEPIVGEIIVGSGCFGGEFMLAVREGDHEKAEKVYRRLRELGNDGKNFYVEIFPHILNQTWVKPIYEKKEIIVEGYFQNNEVDTCTGLPHDVQAVPNQFALAMALKYKDRFLISEDVHIATAEDKIIQDVRLGNNFRFSCSYKLHTPEEALQALRASIPDWTEKLHEEAIDNSYHFIDRFGDFKMKSAKKDGFYLPSTCDVFPGEDDDVALLMKLIERHGRMPDDERYHKRLQEEISLFTKNGINLLPYFFVVYDVVQAGRSSNNLCSLRGSAGGVLIMYLLGCSTTDPIKHDLSLDRFLTPARIKGSMPDVDTDIAARDRALQYIFGKYGDKACLVGTIQQMRLKNALKSVERLKYGSVSSETHMLCKDLESAPMGVTDKQFLFGYTDPEGNYVKGYMEKEDDPVVMRVLQFRDSHPEIWDAAMRAIGIAATTGVHAGGVLIADRPVNHAIPVTQNEDRLPVTQYAMKDVEEAGGVKFDFLGLTALYICGEAMNIIKERHGIDIEWTEYPHDPAVYDEIIKKDKVTGIFQLSSDRALRPWVKSMPCNSIADISALIALVRPGPLDAPSPDGEEGLTAAKYFVQCFNGDRDIHIIHPDLNDILRPTMGVILYQEQIQKIFQILGGCSGEEAVEAMKAVSKKNAEALQKFIDKMKKTLLDTGRWTEEQIVLLADSIKTAGKYSFNCSHSTAYAILAYNMCWLKYHYPLEFWCAQLQCNSDNFDKIKELLGECSKLITQPDITKSDAEKWTIVGDKIVAPLYVVKYAGSAAMNVAHNYKAYKDTVLKPNFEDFLAFLIDQKVNVPTTTAIKKMIATSNFDEMIAENSWNKYDEMTPKLIRQKLKESEVKVDGASIIQLIYTGCFDSLLDIERQSNIIDVVSKAVVTARKILETTAGKSTKTRPNQSVAIGDITTNIKLGIYRADNNPLFSLDLCRVMEDELRRSWEIHGKKRFASRPGFDLLTKLDTLFLPGAFEEYGDWKNNRRTSGCLLAVVESVKQTATKKGDPMAFVELSFGCQKMSATVWKDKETGRLPVWIKLLGVGHLVVVELKPSYYNERKSLTIDGVVQSFGNVKTTQVLSKKPDDEDVPF